MSDSKMLVTLSTMRPCAILEIVDACPLGGSVSIWHS